QDTSPPRGTVIPASRRKYSGGAIRLYGSPDVASRGPVLARGAAEDASGRSPTSSSTAYGSSARSASSTRAHAPDLKLIVPAGASRASVGRSAGRPRQAGRRRRRRARG